LTLNFIRGLIVLSGGHDTKAHPEKGPLDSSRRSAVLAGLLDGEK
jgi:hypothetical protein